MDEQSQKVLDQIIANGPDAITESEAAFLRARRSYLNEDQLAVFKEFLAEPESDEKPSKKAKKEEK